MFAARSLPRTIRLFAAAVLAVPLLPPWAVAEQSFHVSPTGNDEAAGTRQEPFRTLQRAQAAVRPAAAEMTETIVVNLAPGRYRLEQPLQFTEADSGRNGFRVIYRCAGKPGEARILGSVVLTGWKAWRDGIWTTRVPEGWKLDTLYENGRRARKARFPNYEHHPDMPTARGRYLFSEAGSPASKEGETTGWLVYHRDNTPPLTTSKTMRIALFPGGKADWFRNIHPVQSIDPETRRIVIAGRFSRGVGTGARFFLEDALDFLDDPGEFYLDPDTHTLYYMPMGAGHPDTLAIAAPAVQRLVEIRGASREQCVKDLTLEGLSLEETDGHPRSWWGSQYGRDDGALLWMTNTAGLVIRNCRLRNSGRSGIMMIGQNTGNLVTGCRIEGMGVNGITLCNRFSAPGGNTATEDRCAHNRVSNCLIRNVGQIHTYAACVNVFNASENEVSHCELLNSVRYGVTVRGNSGQQYGPMVWNTSLPPARGNRFHHLRVSRCGQDGGDMGALHTANLNIPGGDSINVFEQILVTDTRAIPGMNDIGPNGIFIDWPKMSMHQVFRNVQIVRSQGAPFRSHGPDNGASAQKENVSWEPGFDNAKMDVENIGLTDEFPVEFAAHTASGYRAASDVSCMVGPLEHPELRSAWLWQKPMRMLIDRER